MGEVMSDGAPRFFFEQVQNDEILIFTGHEKSRNADGLPLMERRTLVIIFVVLEGENGQGLWFVQAILHEQDGEYRPHLLKAQGNFFALFLSGVGDDGEMQGANFEPGGWLCRGRRCRCGEKGSQKDLRND